MKKILLALLCLPSITLAAQQEITAVPDSPVLPSIGALKDAVNLRLTDIDENFDEIYTAVGTRPWVIQATAPADTTLAWFDTDQVVDAVVLKIHNGERWVPQAIGEGGSYTLPTAAADTLGGVKVGARLTITDGVLSADVQTGDGDDLGSAAYTDVVALWTTCTGYLKSDGTCDTPSGSATYPSAAGVANWNGSAWGTSYTVGTAANNLVQLNGSAQLPAVSAAMLTSFPTLNQNTTGTAGGLSGQYIDWSASSGGTSIANKPTLGTVAALDYGTDIGDVVRLGDDGNGNTSLPFTLSYTDLTDKPTIPADVGDLTDTGGLLGGSVDSLDDLSDVTLGTPSIGQVLKFNGSIWAPAADSTAEGAGYVSTPPTYSDEACTAGQYAFSTTTGYVCVSSGDWNTFSLTDWNNPTPDTTPAAFSFVDQTDVDTSTEITSALVQITGINAATAVTASGGTAAICTSSNVGDCGTFGASPGNITNNQYVAARHTSSASAESAVDTVVTVGGVSDTFTSTTASAVSGGFVGNNLATTSTGNSSAANEAQYQTFIATESGTIGYCHAETSDADGSSFNIAIYNADGSDLLRDGSLTTVSGTPAVVNVTLDAPLTIVEGTSYILSIGAPSDTFWRVGYTAGTGSYQYDAPMTIGDTMPEPMPTGGTSKTSALLRIWCDNTATGN